MGKPKSQQNVITGYDDFNSRQTKIYGLLYILNKTSNVSNITYIILKIIQYAQIIGLTRKIDFIKNDRYYQMMQTVLQFTNFDVFVQNQDNFQSPYSLQNLTYCLLIMIGIQSFAIICVVISYLFFSYNKDKGSRFIWIVMKIVNYIFLFYKTLLLVPTIMLIVDGYIFSIYYAQNTQIGQIICMTLLICIFMVLIQLGIVFNHPLPSPFIDNHEACQSIIKYLFIASTVIILSSLQSLDKVQIEFNFSIPFFIFTTLIWLVQFTEIKMIYGYASCKNNVCDKTEKILSFTASIYGLFMLIRSHVDENLWNISLYAYLLILVTLMVIYTAIRQNVTVSELTKIRNQSLQISEFYKLINIIEGINNIQNNFKSKLLFEGFLSFHSQNCQQPDINCACQQLPTRQLKSNNERIIIYYQFLVQYIRRNLKKFDNSQEIYILLAQIYQQRLKNRFQAIYFYLKALNCNPNIPMKIKFYQRVQTIQEIMKEDDSKNQQKYSNTSININGFFQFSMLLTSFQLSLQESSNNHVIFWKELLQNKVSLQQLNRQGQIITSQKQYIQLQFEKISDLNPQSTELLKIYADFLFLICNDTENANLIQQKADYMIHRAKMSQKKSIVQNKYSNSTSQTGVIIISGNQVSLGEIVHINKALSQLSGRNRNYLFNKSINCLMPKFFSQKHDLVLNRYLGTSNQVMNNKERIVPLLDSQRYIIPVLALTKAITNLSEGIRIVGFLAQLKNHHQLQQNTFNKQQDNINIDTGDEVNPLYIFYDCSTEIVLGISKDFEEYGITRCLIEGDPDNSGNINKLKMKNLFGVCIEKIQEGAIANEELVLTLDTTKIENQFVIVNNDLNRAFTKKRFENKHQIIQTPISYQKKGKICKVIAKSMVTTSYFGKTVRLLSLTLHKQQIQSKKVIKQYINSYKSANLSSSTKNKNLEQQNSINQNIALKQFKSFTSIKKQSNNVKIINCICNILVILLLASVAIFLWTWSIKYTMNQEITAAIQISSKNRIYLSQLLFQVQKIYINNNEQYGHQQFFNQKQIKQRVNYLWNLAQRNSLLLLTYKNMHKMSKQNITEYILKTSGYQGAGIDNFIQKSLQIDFSIMTWLGKVRELVNGNYQYLRPHPLDFQSLMVNHYLQTKYTGVFSHIQGNINTQYQILQQYRSQIYMHKIIEYTIVGIIGIFLFILVFISGPRTFKLININFRVLSMFNMISKSAVAQIILKCFEFQKQYFPNLEVQNTNTYKIIEQMKPKQDYNHLQSPISPTNQMQTSSGILHTSNIYFEKQKRVKIGSEINQMKALYSQGKLFDGWRRQAIILYTTILFVSISHNIFNIVIGTLYEQQYNSNLVITNILFDRAVHFSQIKKSYSEYLLQPSLASANTTVKYLNEHMLQIIYENQKQVVQKIQKSSQFQNYLSYDSINICEEFGNYSSFTIYQNQSYLSQSQCNQIDDGLLQKGVQNVLVHQLQRIRSVLSSHINPNLQQQFIRLDQVNTYTIAALMQRANSCKEDILTTLHRVSIIFYVINGILIILYLIFWKTIWRIFALELDESIWNTKSMLNIIPQKIIKRQSVFMHYICSGQFQKAVN